MSTFWWFIKCQIHPPTEILHHQKKMWFVNPPPPDLGCDQSFHLHLLRESHQTSFFQTRRGGFHDGWNTTASRCPDPKQERISSFGGWWCIEHSRSIQGKFQYRLMMFYVEKDGWWFFKSRFPLTLLTTFWLGWRKVSGRYNSSK